MASLGPPFFTILTAALNSAATLRRTLESVRAQSFPSLQHLVMDGGSQDGTQEILKEFEQSYALQWTSQRDRGIADALNRGLRRARGRYVLVLQADDRLLHPRVLAQTHRLLAAERDDIATFPVFLESAPGSRQLLRPIRVPWWIHFKTIFPHQGTFVHRRVCERLGGFREDFAIALDYDFFYRALLLRPRVSYGDRPVAVMSAGGVSTSRKYLEKRLGEEYRVQLANERNVCWRKLQRLFRALYVPYKVRLGARMDPRWEEVVDP